MEKDLHIVSFDVPYPADYGGVIDVFYMIKTLHQLGVRIQLHCFEYGRGQQEELKNHCASVHYYQRNQGHKGFSHKLPYIVCSRSSSELCENLLKDEHPVLLEGIHCTYLLGDPRFEKRKLVLRLHNVEHEYYRHLFSHEQSLLRKIYYLHESWLLKRHEKKISTKVMIVAMSKNDLEKYSSAFGTIHIAFLPAFHPFDQTQCLQGTGCFCLYHGNLSVAENESAAIWLLKKVFAGMEVPFVIAGKKPSEKLRKQVQGQHNACLIEDPDEEELSDMICKAQINIVPSFNGTGIKLKLLNAVFRGRHCITNPEAVDSTGLDKVCHIGRTPEDFRELVTRLHKRPFPGEEIQARMKILSDTYDNRKNAEKLIAWIW